MIKFMVIGGNGFLGKSIVKHLISCCFKVEEIRIFDIKEDVSVLSDSRIKFIKETICNQSALCNAMHDVNVVFHCAELKKGSELEIEDTNYRGTLNVINACILCNVECLIYAGVFCFNRYNDYFYQGDETSDYYKIFDEPYSKTKHLAEFNVIKADQSKTAIGKILRTCSVQSFNLYGEEDKTLKNMFVKAFKQGSNINTCYNKMVQQSKTYVGNAAWMHIMVYKTLYNCNRADKAGGQIFFTYDYTPCLNSDDFKSLLFLDFGITSGTVSKKLLKLKANINDLLGKIGQKRYPNSKDLIQDNTYCVFNTVKAKNNLNYSPLYKWIDCKNNIIYWLWTLT